MSWSPAKHPDPAVKFGTGKKDTFSKGALADSADRAVRVITARRNSYSGYIRSVNAVVIILDHPRGGPFAIPSASVVQVLPLPDGTKI